MSKKSLDDIIVKTTIGVDFKIFHFYRERYKVNKNDGDDTGSDETSGNDPD